MSTATTWTCPNNPFHHDWNGSLACRSCDATRTAAEAITSLLAGWEGWDHTRATALVDQHRAETLGHRPDFFQPGHTYRSLDGIWTFDCRAVTRHPDPRINEDWAIGWHHSDGTWHIAELAPDWWKRGWTDITPEGTPA
ncbi:hypothetical protein [Streptomyces sp. NPDC007991]|uniref:hypothetical protein n=1 Tax=Streptomyces sp. NPDC007991 TaxID=3364803 RepID=UPI0036E40ABE